MNRISSELRNSCELLAKEICTEELIEKLVSLDKDNASGDAFMKGVLVWQLVKCMVDFNVRAKLVNNYLNKKGY